MKYTIDTNIISTYRIGDLPDGFHMSAVVLSERMTAANDEKEFRAYRDLWRRHDADGTLLVPTPDDWLRVSRVLFLLAQERKQMAGGKAPRRSPAVKQELAMDVLIAMCARRERVTIVTDDGDYDSVRHIHKDLKLMSGADFLKLL